MDVLRNFMKHSIWCDSAHRLMAFFLPGRQSGNFEGGEQRVTRVIWTKRLIMNMFLWYMWVSQTRGDHRVRHRCKKFWYLAVCTDVRGRSYLLDRMNWSKVRQQQCGGGGRRKAPPHSDVNGQDELMAGVTFGEVSALHRSLCGRDFGVAVGEICLVSSRFIRNPVEAKVIPWNECYWSLDRLTISWMILRISRTPHFIVFQPQNAIGPRFSDVNFDSVKSEYLNIWCRIVDLSNHTCL